MEEVSWQDVRKQVKTLAPDIFDAIEQLEPDSSYKLYKIKYPYGATILGKNVTFQVPNAKAHLVPLDDSSVNPKLQEELGYNWGGLPMSLVMSGQVDLLLGEIRSEIGVTNVYKNGVVMALRAILDPAQSYQTRHLWRAFSGSRAPYMLASIADNSSFNRLRKPQFGVFGEYDEAMTGCSLVNNLKADSFKTRILDKKGCASLK